MRACRIVSVGHGSRSQQEMRSLLTGAGITVLVDVRRFPTSSRFPHFSAASLRGWLSDAGIRYVPMGEGLGGFRPGGYPAWMGTPTFRQALQELARLACLEQARGGLVAFMCSERWPWRCHRRYIAQALQALGLEVVHLLDGGRLWVPRRGGLPATPSLFDADGPCPQG